MTIAYVASATGTTASVGAVLDLPTEVQAGDLLVAVVATNAAPGYAQVTPDGWTLTASSHGSSDGGSQFASLYQRIAEAGDAGAQLVVEVTPDNPKSVAVAAAYRASDGAPAVIEAAVLPHSGANSTTIASPQAPVDELPATLIAAASKKGGTEAITLTAPDGFTARGTSTADGGGSIACTIADTAAAATGETTVGPWDSSVSSGAGTGFLLAVRDEAPEPPAPPEFPDTLLRLVVEIAPGADILNEDEFAWPWVQIPASDLQHQSIAIKRGRADETSHAQPATASLTLINQQGQYTPGNPNSPHFPHLTRGMPIRISIDYHDVRIPRFVGHIDSWVPQWPWGDVSVGPYPGESLVQVTASSLMRRMSQGVKPLKSALTRELAGPYRSSSAAAYWPCEDGQSASAISSALEGGRPMDILGSPNLASYSEFLASSPLPTMRDGAFIGPIAEYPDTGQHFFRSFLYLPNDPQISDGTTMFRLTCTGGDVQTWLLQFYNPAAISLLVLDSNGQTIYGTAPIAVELTGSQISLALSVTQTAPNTVAYTLLRFYIRPDGTTDASQFSGSFGGRVGKFTQIEAAPARNAPDMVCGHIAFSSDDSYFANTEGPFLAWRRELAGDRMRRLANEESLYLQVDGEQQYEQQVGPQLPKTLLELLHETADTDSGVLADSVTHFGLEYRNPGSMYAQTPQLVLDARQGQITHPFGPVLDDQRLRNDVTAASVLGETGRYYIDQPELGRYDEQVSLNPFHWTQLENLAAWRVALGTWPGMRYPAVSIDLSLLPTNMIGQWVTLALGDRIQVTGLPPQHPTDTVDLMVEGYTETLSPTRWTVEIACSPAGPWIVGTVGDTTLAHLSPADAALTSAIDETNTSITVSSTGRPWTTDAADLPIAIVIGGETMRVTAVAPDTSPQTFSVERSVNSIVKSHPAGAGVTLADPLTLGI